MLLRGRGEADPTESKYLKVLSRFPIGKVKGQPTDGITHDEDNDRDRSDSSRRFRERRGRISRVLMSMGEGNKGEPLTTYTSRHGHDVLQIIPTYGPQSWWEAGETCGVNASLGAD